MGKRVRAFEDGEEEYEKKVMERRMDVA